MKVELVTKQELDQVLSLLEEINRKLDDIVNSNVATNQSWLKGKQVCEILGCSASTLQNYRIKGVLQFRKIGGTVYYSSRSINLIGK
ncbi:MAG: DNA-binding protein [Bacteroidetes bacterium]|nr:MAG: DNA-binding protein [Bacteroidota bacterium]